MGPTIAKPNAKKVRRVASGKSEILVGFAAVQQMAMSFFDRLEKAGPVPRPTYKSLRGTGKRLAH